MSDPVSVGKTRLTKRRLVLAVLLTIVMCVGQYLATAPFGVGGYVGVLVSVEILVAFGAIVAVLWGQAIESSSARRNSESGSSARFIGPVISGIIFGATYLLVTMGYPAPISYIVIAIGVIGATVNSGIMWLTSPFRRP